jgi:hypothetical protein
LYNYVNVIVSTSMNLLRIVLLCDESVLVGAGIITTGAGSTVIMGGSAGATVTLMIGGATGAETTLMAGGITCAGSTVICGCCGGG